MATKPARKIRLGPEAWIEAALQVLAEQGPRGVSVEPLARVLGVTKGSFYWHFKDRADLVRALLATWEFRAADDVVASVESGGGTPAEKLVRLFTGSRGGPLYLHAAPTLEGAVRAWAAEEALAQDAVKSVDKKRRAYIAQQLTLTGLPKAEAKLRARLLYLTMLGEAGCLAAGAKPSKAKLWLTALAGIGIRR